ncbi:MAG: hypothetical protein C0467_31730 [Planctomycetaceae bacterium]|nr:hypothetical protein [Planctomycetaceae bacterium]
MPVGFAVVIDRSQWERSQAGGGSITPSIQHPVIRMSTGSHNFTPLVNLKPRPIPFKINQMRTFRADHLTNWC